MIYQKVMSQKIIQKSLLPFKGGNGSLNGVMKTFFKNLDYLGKYGIIVAVE